MSNNFPLITAHQSTDTRITDALKQARREIFSIQTMPGTGDLDIITMAVTKSGFILTKDKDFGDEIVLKKISN